MTRRWFRSLPRRHKRDARRDVRPGLAGCEPLEGRACLAAGGLDASFGVAGKTLGSFAAGWRETATATTVDAQGRTLVAGSLDFGMGKDFSVFRYLPDGTLDTTFAGTGHRYVWFDLGGGNDDTASAIAVDAQGRIVVAGTASTAAHGRDLVVCRLTSTGLFDQSFDGDGRASFGFDAGGTNDDVCGAMMIDSHGRIVVAASVSGQVGSAFGVARLDDAGHLDTAFDVDGKAVVSFANGSSGYAFPSGVAADSQGRLVVTGTVLNTVGKPPHQVFYGGVARLLPQGAPDPTFGVLGKRLIASGVASEPLVFGSVAVDAADRLVLAGTRGNRFSVVRLQASGKFDLTFGTMGRKTVQFAFAPKVPGFVLPMMAGGRLQAAIDAAGRIVVAATAISPPNTFDVGIIRLTKKGLVDATFDGDGRAAVSFNAGGDDRDLFGGLAIDGQGRIIVSATVTRNLQDDTDIGVARLLG